MRIRRDRLQTRIRFRKPFFIVPVGPDGKSWLQCCRCPCPLIYFMQKAQRRRVRLVNLNRFFKKLAGFFIFRLVDILKRQQVIALYQFGVLRQDLFELDHCHIFIAVMAVLQGYIIFLYSLVDDVEPVGILLKIFNIFRCNIVIRLDILGNDPLRQSCYHFTGLEIDKTQKISCRNVQLVKFQASPELINSSAQIPYLRLFQSLVVIKTG